MHILAIESTCDETAAAVVTDRLEELSSVVASQDDLHRRFGGVVPEIASRAHVENILPVIDEALRKAGVTLADIDAVAVANTPGLAGSLLVGLSAAKAICVARQIPLIAVNHLQAHIYACRLAAGRDIFPCVGLIVSGGHSSLYRCNGPIDFEYLGGTIDDAAGEAFDKVAAMLGLAYPGGPSIQRASADGNRRAFAFPRPFLRDDRLDFSFSGLKTAVRYAVEGPGKSGQKRVESGEWRVESGSKPNLAESANPKSPNPQVPKSLVSNPQSLIPNLSISDLAASFQEAVVDCLVGKAMAALERTGATVLCVGGGVAANTRLRERLTEEAARRHVDLHIAPPRLCTDNAAMGAIAVERWNAGLIENLDLDAFPGVVRTPPASIV